MSLKRSPRHGESWTSNFWVLNSKSECFFEVFFRKKRWNKPSHTQKLLKPLWESSPLYSNIYIYIYIIRNIFRMLPLPIVANEDLGWSLGPRNLILSWKFTPDIFKTQLLSLPPATNDLPLLVNDTSVTRSRHVATNHYCGAQTAPAIWRITTFWSFHLELHDKKLQIQKNPFLMSRSWCHVRSLYIFKLPKWT